MRRCSKACSNARLSSNVFGEPPVKLRSPVAEEAECGAVLLRRGKVERGDQNARLLRAELREDVAALVTDETVAVEALAALGPDAIGGDDGHDVRDGVPDHRPPRLPRRVEVWIVRLGA